MRVGLLDAALASFNTAERLSNGVPGATLNGNLEALKQHMAHATKMGHGKFSPASRPPELLRACAVLIDLC